jgi:hypothetical protein
VDKSDKYLAVLSVSETETMKIIHIEDLTRKVWITEQIITCSDKYLAVLSISETETMKIIHIEDLKRKVWITEQIITGKK